MNHNFPNNQVMLIDAFVQTVVKIAPELLSTLKEVISSNRDIESRLLALDMKLDQLIVREINGALQLIDSIATVASANMKERHLLEAESNLLKNIGLDPALSTAGLPNAIWIGRAFFGLSNIALLRSENKDASRFMLKLFAISPRDARRNLAKGIFSRLIEPNCKDVAAEYERKKKLLPQYESQANKLRSQMFWKRGMGGLGVAAVLFLPQTNYAAIGGTFSAYKREIAQIQAKLAAVPTAESMQLEMETALDGVCSAFANRLLTESGQSLF